MKKISINYLIILAVFTVIMCDYKISIYDSFKINNLTRADIIIKLSGLANTVASEGTPQINENAQRKKTFSIPTRMIKKGEFTDLVVINASTRKLAPYSGTFGADIYKLTKSSSDS